MDRYGFAGIALISLPAAIASREVVVIVSWVAQTFLQLVLLPIIIVGQNVIQAANDARAEADHETLTAVHRITVEVHAINEAQTAILKEPPEGQVFVTAPEAGIGPATATASRTSERATHGVFIDHSLAVRRLWPRGAWIEGARQYDSP